MTLSHNPLKMSWSLTADDFSHHTCNDLWQVYETTCDDKSALTEAIARVESETDRRVKSLYRVDEEKRN